MFDVQTDNLEQQQKSNKNIKCHNINRKNHVQVDFFMALALFGFWFLFFFLPFVI